MEGRSVKPVARATGSNREESEVPEGRKEVWRDASRFGFSRKQDVPIARKPNVGDSVAPLGLMVVWFE